MRGYVFLKRSGKIGEIRSLKNKLVAQKIQVVHGEDLRFVFGASSIDAEIVVRQFILERYSGRALYSEILRSLGTKGSSIVHPMPRVWQSVLVNSGYRVDAFRSSLLWSSAILLRYIHGAVSVVRIFITSFSSILRGAPVRPVIRYVYFDGLKRSNLPATGLPGDSYDICSWYIKTEVQSRKIDALCHSVFGVSAMTVNGVVVAYSPPPYELLSDFRSVVRFGRWGIKAIAIAGMNLFRGRWCNAMLLAEAAKAKMVQLISPNRLAVKYLFHFSGGYYRPMWTYEAERSGAGVALYFYSTSDQIKLPSGYESQKFEWGPANWPQYIVWDTYQASALRRAISPEADVVIAGPIHFSDSEVQLPKIPGNAIAVFDMQPHRKSIAFGLTTLADYWAKFPDVYLRFLHDVESAIAACHGVMVLKGKRDIGSRIDKCYKALVDEITSRQHVIAVDPSISATRVAKKCRAGISVPFTSTALLLKEQGVPSAYYDPTGWLEKDDEGAHGIQILSGKAELISWVNSALSEGSQDKCFLERY